MSVKRLKNTMFRNDHQVALDYWDRFAQKQSLEIAINPARKAEWEKIREIFDITPETHPEIIELGVGTGYYAINFLKEGFRVTGVDVSGQSLKVCQKRAKHYGLEKGLQLVQFDFKKPMFKNKFDAGYLLSTFHCLSNNPKEQEVILKNFISSIKRDGSVLFMEPNPFNIFFYLAYPLVYKENWKEGYNIIHSSSQRIKALLKEGGISNIQEKQLGFFPLRFINRFRCIKEWNEFLCQVPLIRKFCLFNLFIGTKN